MSQYHQILILPLIALALSILFPLFTKDLSLSNSWKSRRRRRIIRGRIAVVALLLATVFTELFPIEGMNIVIQGLFFTALIMIPACIVHWVLYTRHGDGRDEETSQNNRSSDYDNASIAEAPAPTGKKRVKRTNSQGLRRASGTASSKRSDTDKDSPKVPDLTVFANKANSSNGPHAETDTSRDVQEQMARVSKFVQSHDLDSRGFVAPDDEDPGEAARQNRGSKVVEDKAMIPSATSPSDISKLSTGQISELVASLTKDKSRLQRLVIAQQASIESEREAHDQTRTLTRDAIKVMRSARTAQKHAEKLARRERAERQRVEAQYKKVAASLRNAMSIIEKRKAAERSGDAIPTLRTASVADKAVS